MKSESKMFKKAPTDREIAAELMDNVNVLRALVNSLDSMVDVNSASITGPFARSLNEIDTLRQEIGKLVLYLPHNVG